MDLALDKVPASPAELTGLVRAAARWVGEALVGPDPHRDWPPTLLVQPRSPAGALLDPVAVVLLAPFNEDGEKRAALTQAGTTLFERRIVPAAVVLTVEAWSARMSRKKAAERPPGWEPRHDPDRVEIILIAGQSFMGRDTHSTRMAVGRDPTTDAILPGTWEETERSEMPLMRHLWAGYAEGAAAYLRARGQLPPG